MQEASGYPGSRHIGSHGRNATRIGSGLMTGHCKRELAAFCMEVSLCTTCGKAASAEEGRL